MPQRLADGLGPGRDLGIEPRQQLAPAVVQLDRAAHVARALVDVASLGDPQACPEQQLVAVRDQL